MLLLPRFIIAFKPFGALNEAYYNIFVILFGDSHSKFSACWIPSDLLPVCDRVAHSQRKWKTLSLFPSSLQLQQILLYGRPIFSAWSPSSQCPIIVAVSLYIPFMDNPYIQSLVLSSCLIILRPYLLCYLGYIFPYIPSYLLKLCTYIGLSYPFLAGLVLTLCPIRLERLLT